MSSYARGRRLEYQARNLLIARGYTVVRSAGSKGPVDLVAWNERHVLFIQVKANGQVRSADKQKLLGFPIPKRGAYREIWEKKRGNWSVTRL